MRNYEDLSLVERLTDLLMEHGCTVNKPAMVRLAKFVVSEEVSIIDRLAKDAASLRTKVTLQTEGLEDPESAK